MASKKNAKVNVKAKDGTKAQSANKNGKKSDSGSGSGSFFTWFIVLALLGVWTSVAVVYFDLVDYQGVLGKLVAYDTDGDGDFDVEDAKVLLDEKPDSSRTGLKREPSSAKDVGLKLREALKQQLAIIHERVEAKKLAKLALAEVRELLMKEEEEKELELGRKDMTSRVKERVAARLKEEEEKIEKAEMEKALVKLREEKQPDKKKEDVGKEEDKQAKSGGEEKKEAEGKKAKQEDEGKGESAKEKRKKGKADKSERGGIKKKK